MWSVMTAEVLVLAEGYDQGFVVEAVDKAAFGHRFVL